MAEPELFLVGRGCTGAEAGMLRGLLLDEGVRTVLRRATGVQEVLVAVPHAAAAIAAIRAPDQGLARARGAARSAIVIRLPEPPSIRRGAAMKIEGSVALVTGANRG